MFLDIDCTQQIQIRLQSIIGESIAVLGIRGSGKTNTAAVLIEELLTGGLPLTIVDIEGEYWGLKEKFEILVIGKSENSDIEVTASQASKFAEFSITNEVPMILDLSEFTQSEMIDFLIEYFKGIWRTSSEHRKPYEIILEEAHEFVPQTTKTPLKEMLTRIALRGRKRGLGMILISQRSAKVEKDVLTQASTLFLHRVVHPIDLRIYQEILPLKSKDVEIMVSNLQKGEAIFLDNHEIQEVQIRLRHTYHAGATPELNKIEAPELKKIDLNMLDELRLLAQEAIKKEDIVEILKTQLLSKDAEIETQKEIIADLQSQITILSKLSLSLDEFPVVVQPPPQNFSLSPIPIRNNHAVETIELNLNNVVSEEEKLVKEQRIFESILRDISKLPRFHRSILCFLVEREGVSMGTRDLAKWLEISETTIKNKPPLDLIKMHLLIRSGKRGKYQYRSSVREMLVTQFSTLHTETSIEKILLACK